MYEPQERLGRLYAPNPEDRRYLLRSLTPGAEAAAANVVSRYHYVDTILDQGNTSSCVGASCRGWLNAGPVRNISGPSFLDIYKAGQKIDEWPGEEPAYYGTSVRAGFKVLKSLGYVSTYGWAFDLETALNHILTVGPMVFGTTYTTEMMRADKDGFIHYDGQEVGGHAYLIVGANRETKCPDGSKGAIRMVNSWGRDWAQNGRAWISFKDAEALIKDYGEACTAFESKPA